jgi:glycosyltransferase involved in cell wall biosynthesis
VESISAFKICVNTQTPLVRFSLAQEELTKKYGELPKPLDLDMLTEGFDFQFSPGGVTRMVFPLLKQMLIKGIIEDAHWVSLNPLGPDIFTVKSGNTSYSKKITFHQVKLETEKMKGYGYTKEAIWKTVHGIPQKLGSAGQILWQDKFSDYTYYNRISTERILQLDKENDFDIFYIHDFQQLPIGHMLNVLKPKIFRWHIPFDESMIPPDWKEFLSIYLNSYDTIIVSCKKYLESLSLFGYTGKARYVYPYIDPSPYLKPTVSELAEFRQSFGIRDDDRVVLVVARLDPMKGQDKPIKAIANVIKDIPNVKLVLVGNGSFSSSKQGIGLSKADRWLNELRILVKKLGVENHVIFAGHLSQSQLNAAYDCCDLTVLPSVREGFGLVVIESWLYRKPTIVTSKAGIAEIIEDGKNGLLFDPDDNISLAEKISDLLSDPERAKTLGENGFVTSKLCLIDRAVKEESKVIRELI